MINVPAFSAVVPHAWMHNLHDHTFARWKKDTLATAKIDFKLTHRMHESKVLSIPTWQTK